MNSRCLALRPIAAELAGLVLAVSCHAEIHLGARKGQGVSGAAGGRVKKILFKK